MNKKLVWILIIIFLLMLCCWVILIATGILVLSQSEFIEDIVYAINYWDDQVEGVESLDELMSFNVAVDEMREDYTIAVDSYARLLETEFEENDRIDFFVELGYLYSHPLPPRKPLIYYTVGQQRSFYVPGEDEEAVLIDANLAAKSKHLYFWIEDGVRFNEKRVEFLVEVFENEIYPMNLAMFGSEWSPGIDGDVRINILYAKTKAVDFHGYFQRINEYSKKVFYDSNAVEMFVINANRASLNEDAVLGLMAHEHLHLIHWFADQNEELWFDEGFAELSNYLSGYAYGLMDDYYLNVPDLQLNAWSRDFEYEHYGAGFLFVNYLYTRLGEQAIFDLIQSDENSLQSIVGWLQDQPIFDEVRGRDLLMEDVVLDWMVTNLVLDEDMMDGRFEYKNYADASQVEVEVPLVPMAGDDYFYVVHQFGADYLKVDATAGFDMHFDGDDLIRLVDSPVTQGDFALWSSTVPYSVSRIVHEFDLSEVTGKVRLTFDTWFELIEGEDLVLLMISTDGGENWTTTEALFAEREIDDEFYYWTGRSEGWRNESVDLSDFVGEKVLVRFESLIVEGEGKRGIWFDNLKVKAIDYAMGFEEEDASWQVEGFVRVNDLLPQGFAVAAVIDDGEEKMVEYLTLDAGNQFDFSIDAGEAESVTFVITGTTLFVTDEAGYKIEFR